jgi:membrane carboxypeptidase/penicillin-binding protein PbpC
LNSKPSEIEAAAATLLVVVPAKPWRAKQRLAALKINCRRKSLVMRRVLMLVSKHSPYQMSRILLQCTRLKPTQNHLMETSCLFESGQAKSSYRFSESP